MIHKSYSLSSFVFFVTVLFKNCQASDRMANSFGKGSATGECQDYTGRTVQHAMHFVPPGVDLCKLCICENGSAKACRAVLCTPPPDCKSFEMGSSCCEFICIDDKLTGASSCSDTRFWLIATSITVAVSLALLFFAINRFRQRKCQMCDQNQSNQDDKRSNK